ncbi:hypothetical protein [Streptomyces sp. WMMC897]|nr:hypothetical protein [Streptomyces sp. WMMC897]MCZ7413132.1 hypothetical protein [Streptomyces sp. WMMC897]MCZ7415484.1 hypothetical protein [Streptomyces sp. WMMC897]
MICDRCAHAADHQQPRDAHCNATGWPGAPCTCQHHTDRYRQPNPEQDDA